MPFGLALRAIQRGKLRAILRRRSLSPADGCRGKGAVPCGHFIQRKLEGCFLAATVRGREHLSSLVLSLVSSEAGGEKERIFNRPFTSFTRHLGHFPGGLLPGKRRRALRAVYPAGAGECFEAAAGVRPRIYLSPAPVEYPSGLLCKQFIGVNSRTRPVEYGFAGDRMVYLTGRA